MQELENINLLALNCKHYTKDDPKLSKAEIINLLKKLSGWQRVKNHIYKDFKFKNYYETIAFVNAVAWVVQQQDHHPEIIINYNMCHIKFTTHSINGLSLNDFICSAKINSIQSHEH